MGILLGNVPAHTLSVGPGAQIRPRAQFSARRRAGPGGPARSFRLRRRPSQDAQQGDMTIRALVRARLFGMRSYARSPRGGRNGRRSPGSHSALILSRMARAPRIPDHRSPAWRPPERGRTSRAIELLAQGMDTLERTRLGLRLGRRAFRPGLGLPARQTGLPARTSSSGVYVPWLVVGHEARTSNAASTLCPSWSGAIASSPGSNERGRRAARCRGARPSRDR